MIIEINYKGDTEGNSTYKAYGENIFYAYIENHLIFNNDEDPTPSYISPNGELNLKLEAYNTEEGISIETRQTMYHTYREIMKQLSNIEDVKILSDNEDLLFSLNYMNLKIDSVSFNDFSLKDEKRDQVVFITFDLSWKDNDNIVEV